MRYLAVLLLLVSVSGATQQSVVVCRPNEFCPPSRQRPNMAPGTFTAPDRASIERQRAENDLLRAQAEALRSAQSVPFLQSQIAALQQENARLVSLLQDCQRR